jgi:p25-alpha
LRLIAASRYPSHNPTEQFNKIGAHITQSEARPIAKATATSKDPVTARLTDTTKYTGTSKERFDDDGKGVGMRQGPNITMSNITNRSQADVNPSN